MTEQEIWDRLLVLARTTKGFTEEGVTLKTGWRDEKAHGLDSQAQVELAMDIERAFGISVPDEEERNLQTLGDLVALIQRKVG